ncbi:MAG: ribosome biogenesis GTPase YlqF [Firmicutes bacterium]|nr:ribosome biogenesis GTPase YlqF [Bacillota bacterium]
MIQWYPGHMAKAKREIREKLRIIDIVVELRDSRIPVSSSNPDLPGLLGNKTRIIVLNKSDLSDPSVTDAWINTLSSSGDEVVPVEAVTGKGLAEVRRIASSVAAELSRRMAARGRRPRPARMLVVGVPNVGKSTFINRLAGRSAARTGDRPGVTRGQQWVSVGRSLQLLDTPGLLWPKFDDQQVGIKLAVTSAVDDRLTDAEMLSRWLIKFLVDRYPEVLSRYVGDEHLPPDCDEIVLLIGRRRGCLLSGGRVDTQRTAEMILKDFRAGRIGRVPLERPEDCL